MVSGRQKIAFVVPAFFTGGGELDDIYTVDADGTGRTRITTDGGACCGTNGDGYENTAPAFSADGTKIVFNRAHCYADGGCDTGPQVDVMNADGTAITNLVNSPTTYDRDPDWQPIPQSYVRPKGASPIYASLVPAYKACAAANRTHGTPLAVPSCAPPVQSSAILTVGTADSNGAAANSKGFVRFTVVPGNPSTASDEADVKLSTSISDVRCYASVSAAFCPVPNIGAGNDYNGELQGVVVLRITDRDNTPSPGGLGPATVEDIPLKLTIPCAVTDGPNTGGATGSVCNSDTSVDALYPGAAKEGSRAVWQVGAVEVWDGGTDGLASTEADNTLFMDQGVFVL
jgi:hypothetical protein